MKRRALVISLASFVVGCTTSKGAEFANGAASVEVPSDFRLKATPDPNTVLLIPNDSSEPEIRLTYQSMKRYLNAKPRITTEFAEGYISQFGATRLTVPGAQAAFVDVPKLLEEGGVVRLAAHAAVAFEEALVLCKVIANSTAPASHAVIARFVANRLTQLLSGIKAHGT